MRITTSLGAGLLALALLGACSDDDTPVTAGDDQVDGDGAGDGQLTGVELPDRAPDLVGTITSVEPFVPVTEDCTPPEDLDPEEPVSSEDPPVCTPEDDDVVGTVLVEEDPDDPEGGRKISFTATSSTTVAGVAGFDGLREGQQVETWVPPDGACAESYPEQCSLEAVRVTG